LVVAQQGAQQGEAFKSAPDEVGGGRIPDRGAVGCQLLGRPEARKTRISRCSTVRKGATVHDRNPRFGMQLSRMQSR
jgi:hypothetical protein